MEDEGLVLQVFPTSALSLQASDATFKLGSAREDTRKLRTRMHEIIGKVVTRSRLLYVVFKDLKDH